MPSSKHGYETDSEDNRTRITQLLENYKAGLPFTKELLQNADDARAKKLICGISDKFVTDSLIHPLFKTPGVFILNDGEFTERDNKFFNKFKGSKADSGECIGRFGLGLKSVFHFCEAFFFISDSHSKKPEVFSKVGFRNPWCPDDDDDEKIHIDWEDEFNEDLIAKNLNEFVKPWVEQNEFKNWFLIWVPLRSINYPRNPECLLNENFFYEDQEKKETQIWGEIFGRELDRTLVSTFPLLQSLVSFQIYGLDEQVKVSIEKDQNLQENAINLSSISLNKTDKILAKNIEGELLLNSNSFRVNGLECCQNENKLNPALKSIFEGERWPKHQGKRKKALAHTALLLIFPDSKEIEINELEIQRCAFLPLTDDYKIYGNVSSKSKVTLLLHGYYFTDYARKYALTDKWNQALAENLMAGHIIPRVAEFLNENTDRLSSHDVRKFAKYLKDGRERFFEIKFAIQENFLIRRISKKDDFVFVFESFKYEQTTNLLPVGISEEHQFKDLSSALPGINELLEGKILYLSKSAKIFDDKEISSWNEETLKLVLNDKANFKLDEKENLETIVEFLEGIPHEQLTPHLVRKVLAFSFQKTKPSKFSENWEIIRKLIRFCGEDKILYLDFKKLHGELGEKLLKVFCKKSSDFITFNYDSNEGGRDQNCYQVAEAALDTILSWIDEDPNNEKRVNKGAEIALSIIELCKSEERVALLENRKLLKCGKFKDGESVKNLYSLNQVTEFHSVHQMLRKDYLNEHFAKSIEQGCLFIPTDHWPDFGNPKIDIYSNLETFLQANPIRLHEGEERKKLLSDSIQYVRESNVDANRLHRFFLHGISEQFPNDDISLFEPSSSCWAKVARKLFESNDEGWRILNPDFLSTLSPDQKDILNIKNMEMGDILSELIQNLNSIPSLDLSDLSEEEILEIYDHSDFIESKTEGLFKLLPIHNSIDNKLISIDEHTYLNEGSHPLPIKLKQGFKFLGTPKNEHKLSILKRYVEPLDKLKVLRILLNQDSPTQYSRQIFEILKSHKLTDHKGLKQSVHSTAWNQLSDSGSAISLNKIFHPEYERPARAIIKQAEDNLGCCTAKELQIPNGTKKEDFQKVIREFCIQDSNNLTALKTICYENDIFFGISYNVYSKITDGQEDEDTREKKKAFFRRILGKKSIVDAISPSYTLVKVLSNIWHSSKSVQEIESFLGTEDSDKDLFGIRGKEETISVLKNLAEVSGAGDKLKEDEFQTYLNYLKSSVEKLDTFKEQVLPNTPLLSANTEWKDAQTLCKSDPTISTEFTVDPEVEGCLPSDLPEAEPLARAESIEEKEILKQYFEPWMAFIPKPVIGGFISFLGDLTPGAKELAEKLLQTQTPDQVRTLLILDDKYENPKIFHLKKTPISIASEQGLEATNIIDLRIPVKSFAAGSIPQLFARVRKFFVGGEEDVRLELQFIPIEINPTDRGQTEQLFETFANTWNCILRDNFGFNNRSAVDELIEKLSDTSWVDIYFAQVMVFDGIFRYLRDKNFPNNSEMGKLTLEYNNRLKDKAYANKNNDKSIREEAEESFGKIEHTLNNQLKNILEDRSGALNPDAEFMISDVRNTINKHYQYTQESIPFEIFQNADDALLQLPEKNRPKNTFELIENDNEIVFVHWGRPINSWSGTDLTKKEASVRKYDEDLVKMLFLNSSAKNIDANNNATGKFGVGFKSVYLICDKPKVISDGIDFEIVCGFYPRKLQSAEKEKLESELPSPDKGRTAVVLEKSTISSPETNLLLQFLNNSPFLPVFGRALEEVTIDRAADEKLSFKYSQKDSSTDFWNLGDILENESVKHPVCFFKLGEFGKLLLFFDGKTFSKIPNASTFWVTVPTDVKLGLGFILNGSFHLDIGRASLHRDRSLNEKVIQEMESDFQKGLLELWQYTENEAIHTDYELWNSLWSLFATNLNNRFRDDEDQSGLDLIELLLWGDNQATGYGWFISEKRVIPNGIESNPKLLKKGEVEYKICSKLAEHLDTIKEWDHLNKILSTSVSQNVERILSRFLVQDFSPQFFGLNELVSEDPVWFNGKQANKADAERLGSLFTEQLIGKYDVVYSENNPWKETQKTLSQIRFQSKANQWKDPKELLFSSQSKEDTYTNIETLLCRFAPDEVLLCDEITTSEHAITFFKTCRDEFKCPKESTILNWCSNFSSVSTKTEFLKFLIFNSTLTDSICHRIATNDHIPDWLIKEDLFKFIFKSSILSDREKAVIIGKLFPETLNNLYTDEEDGEPEDEEDHYREQHFSNSGEYLHLILKEFRDRKDHFINLYKEKFYPGSIDPIISPDWEASKNDVSTRKEWLKIFIASLTFRFGFAWPQVTKGFIEKCEREKYLDTFAAPEADPVEWLNLLERWIEEEESSGQNHFQLFGCFPSFFKFSRYLEDYVRNIFSYLDEGNSNSKGITDLKQNTNLDGTGITSPMITKDVSLGAHFIMAEFARITGEGKGTAFYDHCYLPKKSIRKFMIQLGCQGLTEEAHSSTDSKVISDFLKEKLGTTEEDYTFDYCFHIPLLFQSDSRFTPIVQR